MTDYKKIIDKYYPADSLVRGILITHSQNVAAMALEIADKRNLPLDPFVIESAAMLHDIGIFLVNAPTIDCHGKEPYILHGALGAELLRKEGADEIYALVAERHTGSGLTHKEILERDLPLPLNRTYMPESLLEKLICYADCFWSKTRPDEKKYLERVRASISKHGTKALNRFEALHSLFS